MKLNDMIKRLVNLQKQGYGEHDVCYMYDEWDEFNKMHMTVRDTITHAEVADPTDGEEIHLWQSK